MKPLSRHITSSALITQFDWHSVSSRFGAPHYCIFLYFTYWTVIGLEFHPVWKTEDFAGFTIVTFKKLSTLLYHFYISPVMFSKSSDYQMTPSLITWRCPWLSDASQMSQLSAWHYCKLWEKKNVKRRAAATKFWPFQWKPQLTVDIIPRAKQNLHQYIIRNQLKPSCVFSHMSASLCWMHFNELSNHLCQCCLLFAPSAYSFKLLLPVCQPCTHTVIYLLASMLSPLSMSQFHCSASQYPAKGKLWYFTYLSVISIGYTSTVEHYWSAIN